MTSRLSKMVRHAMIMMVGTFASRILGLAREILTAALFGASSQLDAFYVAYTLANLTRQLLAEGALSAAFVPVFSQTLVRDGRERAARLARQALSVLLIAGVVTVICGIFLSPALVKLMAPGFSATKYHLATSLTRFMFPFLILMSLAALAMGVLNSLDRYFIPSVAPALSNIVFIIIVAVSGMKWGVWSLAVAVLAGGVLQFAIQWIWSAGVGVLLVPSKPDMEDRDLKRMLALFLPYAAGLSLNQVNPVISRMLASFLEDGAISVLNYANRIIQLPLGLFVIAISQAVLPELSKCSLDMKDEFRTMIRDSIRFTMFIVLPATVGLIIVSGPMVNLLFFRGAFSDWAWYSTSRALAMYSLGLPGMACTTVIMRGLYAKSMPKDAMLVTFSSVFSNIVLSLVMMPLFSFSGLALATSLAFTISAFIGGRRLAKAIGHGLEVLSPLWVMKLFVSLSLMGGLIIGLGHIWAYPAGSGLLVKSLWLLLNILVGMLSYGLVSYKLGFEEWKWLKSAMTSREA